MNSLPNFRQNNTKQPISHHEYKSLPWHKVGVYIFDYNNKQYLIAIDYFSKYIEIVLLNKGFSSQVVIYVLFCTIICIIFTSLCKNLVKLT